MTIDDGLRRFELCERIEERSGWDRIEFLSRDAAVRALRRLQGRHSRSALYMRRLVAGYAPTGCFQLGEQTVIELAATLLCSGRLALFVEREVAPQCTITGTESAGKGAEFPLSGRTQRPVSSSSALPPDPPTFPLDLNSLLQAGALASAAQQGVPLCPL